MKSLNLIPYLSEKTISSANRRFAFQVLKSANKPEIKKEIEKIFKVKVIKINTLNYQSLAIRKMRFSGQSKGYKLVLATLEKGQKIAGFEMAEEKDKKKPAKDNEGKQGETKGTEKITEKKHE